MKAEIRHRQAMIDIYDDEKKWCKQFLEQFVSDYYNHPRFGNKKYLCEIQNTLDHKTGVLEIHYEDLEYFFPGAKYKDFMLGIKSNSLRYIKFFTSAAEELDIESNRRLSPKEELEQELLNYQIQNFDKLSNIDVLSGKGIFVPMAKRAESMFKNAFKSRFQVIITPGPNSKQIIQKLRDLKAELIGSLVNIKGTVVRITDVRPLIQLATSICTACGEDVFKTVTGKEFMPPVICNSEKCKASNSRGTLIPNFSMSRFIPFQELRIQETTDQTPVGAIPRMYTIYLRGHSVRKCTPGDVVIVNGIFLPKLQAAKNFRDSLLHETYIEGLKIEKIKKGPNDKGIPSNTALFTFQAIAQSKNVVQRLATSIAPEIFGLDHVKKALLFQMVGGSTVSMEDGIRVRGDLNVALIGDPGVAKSQLLKHIAYLSPRGVYTTGKGSSGAGLTASIVRDQKTGEITLEGGALILADLGICCIDEFDKMQDSDKVAIHEVMEQQTISIAKAGITTSLNTRTSILAAANPVYGRYDRCKSPHENIGLSYSLLSRFDLIYILLDKPNTEKDLRLAEHITHLHQNSGVNQTPEETIPTDLLHNYLAYAKTFNPIIPEDLHEYMEEKYVEKRNKNNDLGKFGQYITPRTLLALIRFSIAAAKTRLSERVEKRDVDIVLELMDQAQDSVMIAEKEREYQLTKKSSTSLSSQVYQMIKRIFNDYDNQPISFAAIERSFMIRGISKDALQKCISEYEECNLFQKVNEGTMLAIVH